MARPLLLCAVLVVGIAGGLASGRRYRPSTRSIQRRAGSPFTGDLHQSFEDYLAAQGISFDSLFEEPSDLRSEEEPARRRVSPAAAYEKFPARPAAPYGDPSALERPAGYSRRPEPPQTFLYRDSPPLSYGDLSEQRRPATQYSGQLARDRPSSYSDLAAGRPAAQYNGQSAGGRPLSYSDLASGRPAAQYSGQSAGGRPLSYSDQAAGRPAAPLTAEEPEQVVRRVVVERPVQRARRPVVQLRPAPADPQPSLDTVQTAAARSQDLPDPRDYVAPYPEQESLLRPTYDQAQAEASPRQDGYSLNIPKKKEKQRLEFQVHGQEGPHSYRFGYDTGTGYNRQFRFEERDGYGNTKGRYGFYDKSGKLQVVNYSASPKGGFHAEGDFGKYPNAGH